MRKVRLALAALLAVACVAGTQQMLGTWVVPQQVFFQKVDTIGLGPVWVPESLENPAPVRALFDSLISQQLRLAGYVVVRVPEMRAISDSEMADHKAFNPSTGEKDTTAMRTATAHSLGRLAKSYPQVDAFMMPDLDIVGAQVDGRSAYWHGTKQGFGSFSDLLLMRGYYGNLPAFSLCVRFWDPAGKLMFHNDGGVELAGIPNKAIERSKLFVDAERNLNGVRIALGPVLTRPVRKPAEPAKAVT